MSTKCWELQSSWDRLNNYTAHGWIFRGQRDAGWPLKSSLERFCDRRHVPPADRAALEYRLGREFRRGYHQYALHIPAKASVLEWLGLMQHYGCPTRLLDFTYSIYVAAYFALEHSEGDSVVWCINGPWALDTSVPLLERAGNPRAAELKKPYDEGDDHVFGDVFLGSPVPPCVCPQNPYRLNERLRIQMGVFITPACVDVSFDENLRALLGYELRDHIVKVVIPAALREQALARLFDMGLSRRTLFPGLDGYAQSLSVYSPALNPIQWA